MKMLPVEQKRAINHTNNSSTFVSLYLSLSPVCVIVENGMCAKYARCGMDICANYLA